MLLGFKVLLHFLILASAITVCVLNSYFASLLGIAIGIMSSAIVSKMCAITAKILDNN